MTTLAKMTLPDRPEKLLRVDQYMRMIETGILTKRDKVELIEGRIVEKIPTDPPRVATLERVFELLRNASGPNWIVRIDAPLQLENSVPEPDLMLLRGPRDRYDNRHPTKEDVLLVVEVSDSTLRDDRTEKARLYAGAGIPFYWIVNLVNRRLEVHSDASGPDVLPTYRAKVDVPEDGKAVLRFPQGTAVELSVKDMFPKSTSHN